VLYYFHFAFLEKHGTHFDEKHVLGLAAPDHTVRFFRGTPFQALRARLRSVSSLRDAALLASGRKFPDVTFCKCPNFRGRGPARPGQDGITTVAGHQCLGVLDVAAGADHANGAQQRLAGLWVKAIVGICQGRS
jgi:hypothetical protein